MSFILIFDPDPLLGAPRFFGPFASEEEGKRYAEAEGMTLGRDFNTAAAEADSTEGHEEISFPCAIGPLEPVTSAAWPATTEPT
ncbi:hypothetical protein HVPorG_04546 (plasmid) [Roseomonas mucosa]|uniref:hypothetical protein n=1 Tax=Roseomonas mucosa TaxID=207340 RepID=UPI00220520EF|nr:hypothetical protein [Roseomonas mucosa]QDJ12037.1 hypothetical protein HVPorG_04546 [Roseomonas mucosa]